MARDGRRPARPAVLAVDAGNSKADVLVVSRTGELLGAARRFGLMNVGRTAGSVEPLVGVVDAAFAEAGVEATARPLASVGVYCLAGADFRTDERRIGTSIADRGWSARSVVRNDTFA